MKKWRLVFVLLFVMAAFAVSAFAQDEPAGPTVNPVKVSAILLLATGGVAALLTQLAKSWFKWTGTLAVILNGFVGVVCTGIYFLLIDPMSPWNWVSFVLYSVVVFGEATAYYHFYAKAAAAVKPA